MKRDTKSPCGAEAKAGPPDSYPQGIEALLRKAASDPLFREQLLEQRAGAAAVIGLELDPAEKAMLESVPREQLLLTIERLEATRERRRGFLVKLAVASVVAAAAGGVWLWRRREPSYKGKSLSEWLVLGERFGWGYYVRPIAIAGSIPYGSTFQGQPNPYISLIPSKPEMVQVEEALRAMGTNAIPPLIASLETKDPAWKLRLMNWLGKQKAVKIHFTKAGTCQKRALIGLTILGPLATNAVPAIEKAMDSENMIFDEELLSYAIDALERITGKSYYSY